MAAPEPLLNEFALEQIGQLHGIAADLFVPFVIQRLSRSPDVRACDLYVELVGIGGVAHAERRLRITWQAASGFDRPPGVQDPVVTEWAALHRAELMEDWDLARAEAQLKAIAPLE